MPQDRVDLVLSEHDPKIFGLPLRLGLLCGLPFCVAQSNFHPKASQSTRTTMPKKQRTGPMIQAR
jgi:hypothetical protein